MIQERRPVLVVAGTGMAGAKVVEELLTRSDLDPDDVVRRARRMDADLSDGAVALCADPGERAAGHLLATIAEERWDAIV